MPQGHADDRAVGELLVRSARGDHEAFTGVYDALADSVMGLAFRILRNAAQAEEVTQDVMVEIWRTAYRYEPERGTARAWVLTVAHRRAVDRVRTAQAGAERERRAAMLSERRPFDEVAEAVEGQDERRRVFSCLGRLGRDHRVPLVLAYYEGLTYLEVAQSLSTPPGTVKSRIRTALRKLRACLEGGS
ncbi:ECF RNA polymerase sigma factor SigK [Streptomyces sp. NPDC056362]|uniref:ECF RNA polymerase sigma factor SigK n=1 Tax=unclassified Streptomyces TaxID=2593676 RepID=UPI0035DC3BAD